MSQKCFTTEQTVNKLRQLNVPGTKAVIILGNLPRTR